MNVPPRSIDTQAAACQQAAAWYRKRQSGPTPGSKEGLFIAGLLEEAAATLRALADQRKRGAS